MFDPDPRAAAVRIVDQLHDGAVRLVFRALIHDRDHEARARLVGIFGPDAHDLDLGEPVLREWLLEALEYRISPPDDEDLGITRPTGAATLAFDVAA